MCKEKITNTNVMRIDYAGEERRAFLRKLQCRRKSHSTSRKKVPMWHGCWMTDVSISDPRSVKAQLSGRISGRVLWWNLNFWIHKILQPRVSMESVMYRFHLRHHMFTFLLLNISAILQMMIIYQAHRNNAETSTRSGVTRLK
jgi:hypothetical protein